MINKLSQRHCNDGVEGYKRYIIKCPCCGTILGFGRDDVYRDEDCFCIHHEYIACPECREEIQLNDDFHFGY